MRLRETTNQCRSPSFDLKKVSGLFLQQKGANKNLTPAPRKSIDLPAEGTYELLPWPVVKTSMDRHVYLEG